MSRSTIESSTLQRAAQLLGGQPMLAKELQVPVMVLDRWLSGEEQPPRNYFLRAVDLVLRG